MTKTFLILFVCALSFVARAQEFKTIKPGVEYAQFVRELQSNDKEAARAVAVVNALRLDLSKVRLDVVHALDAAIGVEKTSSIARRHNAFAAINGGFFRIDNSIFRGDATGVLAINNRLLSESYANRIALFISNRQKQTEINFANINLNDLIEIKSKTFYFSGINRERKENEIIQYTPEFNRTTLTDGNGLEIVVCNGKIAQINDLAGSSPIPQNCYVVSSSGSLREQLLSVAKIGGKVKIRSAVAHKIGNGFPNTDSNRTSAAFSTAEDIIGGAPQLIKNGKIEITWEAEKQSKSFVETKHPRTAIAKLKDGRALLVTVDGRSEDSGGMSLPEMAEMLLEMNAVDAMNLDGGGSTTMFLDGKLVNKPSDKEGERAVSDAILVTLR